MIGSSMSHCASAEADSSPEYCFAREAEVRSLVGSKGHLVTSPDPPTAARREGPIVRSAQKTARSSDRRPGERVVGDLHQAEHSEEVVGRTPSPLRLPEPLGQEIHP